MQRFFFFLKKSNIFPLIVALLIFDPGKKILFIFRRLIWKFKSRANEFKACLAADLIRRGEKTCDPEIYRFLCLSPPAQPYVITQLFWFVDLLINFPRLELNFKTGCHAGFELKPGKFSFSFENFSLTEDSAVVVDLNYSVRKMCRKIITETG